MNRKIANFLAGKILVNSYLFTRARYYYTKSISNNTRFNSNRSASLQSMLIEYKPHNNEWLFKVIDIVIIPVLKILNSSDASYDEQQTVLGLAHNPNNLRDFLTIDGKYNHKRIITAPMPEHYSAITGFDFETSFCILYIAFCKDLSRQYLFTLVSKHSKKPRARVRSIIQERESPKSVDCMVPDKKYIPSDEKVLVLTQVAPTPINVFFSQHANVIHMNNDGVASICRGPETKLALQHLSVKYAFIKHYNPTHAGVQFGVLQHGGIRLNSSMPPSTHSRYMKNCILVNSKPKKSAGF